MAYLGEMLMKLNQIEVGKIVKSSKCIPFAPGPSLLYYIHKLESSSL